MFLGTDAYYSSLLGIKNEQYKALSSDLKEALSREDSARFSVCLCLYRFNKAIGRRRKCSFYRVIGEVFHLDRTQVARSIQLVEEFGNEEKNGLLSEYRDFSFSLLLELLTIPRDERYKVQPSWTVRNVRELRKILENNGDLEDEEEEKPPEKYVRFKKWKRADLCDKILALEKELEEMKETLRTAPAVEPGERKE